MTHRFLLGPLAAALLVVGPVQAEQPPAPPAAPPAPGYVDDQELLDRLTEKLGKLAAAKKCLPPDQLKKKVAADKTCAVAAAAPTGKRLDPEDVYDKVLSSVFVVGSVVEDDGEFAEGRMATAWVLAADGVLVTNAHVLDQVEDGEFFGVMSRAGDVYPLTDVIGLNKAADVAVFRVAAAGLAPLPVAAAPARVGAWVGVLGHPGDRYFSFTQGHVTRYTKVKPEKGGEERWMAVTADYAYGSSGSPVLDRTGAVVGMAALTETIDYPDDDPAPEAKPKDPPGKDRGDKGAEPPKKDPPADPKDPAKKDAPPAQRGSLVQMVVKLTTPAAEIRAVAGGK